MGRARIAPQLPRLRAVGVSLFTLGVDGPRYDRSRLRRWIEWRDAANARNAANARDEENATDSDGVTATGSRR